MAQSKKTAKKKTAARSAAAGRPRKAGAARSKAKSAARKTARAAARPARARAKVRKGARASAARRGRPGAAVRPASARRPQASAPRARRKGQSSRAGAAPRAQPRAVTGERTAALRPPAAPGRPELNVSDDALHKATGRTWAQWFAALDAEGARTLPHSDILRLVFQRFRLNPGWSQTVTVGYEQAHGLREKHEQGDGYSASASKTLAAPAERVYAAWNMDAERGRWLGMNLKVRSATPPKSIRLNWSDPISQIVVMLNPRGAGKTHVAVEHSRLKDRAESARMRTFWASALERLGAAVGGR